MSSTFASLAVFTVAMFALTGCVDMIAAGRDAHHVLSNVDKPRDTGTPIEDKALAKLEVGKTTPDEAVRILGRPGQDLLLGPGQRSMTFQHVRVATNSPSLGSRMFMGYMETSEKTSMALTQRILNLTFESGVLKSCMVTDVEQKGNMLNPGQSYSTQSYCGTGGSGGNRDADGGSGGGALTLPTNTK